MSCRGWVFTINNYTEQDEQQLRLLGRTRDTEGLAYLVYGRETGASGTPHLQGYLEFETPQRLAKLQRLVSPRGHYERRRGSPKQAADYAKKDNDFEEFGDCPVGPGQGKRTDLDTVREAIRDSGSLAEVARICRSAQSFSFACKAIQFTEPERDWKPVVHWYHGPPGTGKTRRAMHEAQLLGLGRPYVKTSDTKWFPGYDAHQVVIFDDLRTSTLGFSFLLQLLDRYACQVEFKGGNRQFLARHIFVTSCHNIRQFTPNDEDDRQLSRRVDYVEDFSNDYSMENPWRPPVMEQEEHEQEQQEQVQQDEEVEMFDIRPEWGWTQGDYEEPLEPTAPWFHDE